MLAQNLILDEKAFLLAEGWTYLKSWIVFHVPFGNQNNFYLASDLQMVSALPNPVALLLRRRIDRVDSEPF